MAEIQYTSLLRSTAADNKLAKTDQLYDEAQKKFQQAINADLLAKVNAVAGPLRIKGTKATIAEVLALTDAKVGDVWNITAEFTLGGKKYPAGTNVACITATSSGDHNDDNWDALGGTVDLAPYLKSGTAASTYATKTELGNKADKSYVDNNFVGKNDAERRKAYSIGALDVLDFDTSLSSQQLIDAFGTPDDFSTRFNDGYLFLATRKGHGLSASPTDTSEVVAAVTVSEGNGNGNYDITYPSLVTENTQIIVHLEASSGGEWTLEACTVRAINPLTMSTADARYLQKTAVVNTLTETASGKALDARQGKALNDKVTAAQSTADQANSKCGSLQTQVDTLASSMQEAVTELAAQITIK